MYLYKGVIFMTRYITNLFYLLREGSKTYGTVLVVHNDPLLKIAFLFLPFDVISFGVSPTSMAMSPSKYWSPFSIRVNIQQLMLSVYTLLLLQLFWCLHVYWSMKEQRQNKFLINLLKLFSMISSSGLSPCKVLFASLYFFAHFLWIAFTSKIRSNNVPSIFRLRFSKFKSSA